MSSAINRKRTAAIALGVQRAHKFSRVSAAFIDQMEAEHIANVQRRVRELPSKGKTIK
tara:strand:- start:764 stop:937 length:174 start_codon:yes stop_codon:yes gene_type:complete